MSLVPPSGDERRVFQEWTQHAFRELERLSNADLERARRLGEIDRQLAGLAEQTKGIENQAKFYVTRFEFQPVRAIAYGLASLLMMTVILAVLRLALVK